MFPQFPGAWLAPWKISKVVNLGETIYGHLNVIVNPTFATLYQTFSFSTRFVEAPIAKGNKGPICAKCYFSDAILWVGSRSKALIGVSGNAPKSSWSLGHFTAKNELLLHTFCRNTYIVIQYSCHKSRLAQDELILARARWVKGVKLLS